MKYLPLQTLDDVTSALNFETSEQRVVGGCDIYTTKAAGSDKKLYRDIEKNLESQYEAALRISASLSPTQGSSAAAALNLSRSSPFGPLSQISSRRTFAYLIATLNASNPDYDFSSNARPFDFRRERNLRAVMNALDATLNALRPKKQPAPSSPTQNGWSSTPPDGDPLPVGPMWSPKMWRRIDNELNLRECSVFAYAPEEPPWAGDDEDEPVLWSVDYFFFNKARKRVCYFYLRGLSALEEDANGPRTPMSARSVYESTGGFGSGEPTSAKRAAFWLGETNAAVAQDVENVRRHHDDDEGEETQRRMVASASPEESRLLPADAKRAAASPDSEMSAGLPPPVAKRRSVRRKRGWSKVSRDEIDEMVAGTMDI